jgi:hypothetical protein
VTAFLVLYAGQNVTNAEAVAMTANRKIVDHFAKLMLARPPGLQESADVVPLERKSLEMVKDQQT